MKKKINKILIILSSILTVLFISLLTILYGPWNYVRDTLVTTAMTTLSHQYLAKFFYSDSAIEKILSKHTVEEFDYSTNPNDIEIEENKPIIYENEYEEAVLKKDENNDLYKIIEVSGNNYKGYLVVVYDSAKVRLASTKYLGETGQFITTMAKDNNAVIAINGGGFYDPNWMGNGGTPTGIVIKDGEIIFNGAYDSTGGIIGFNYDNKLILTKTSAQDAIDMGIRDAVSFGPFLIVNGNPAFIRGNGGWGIAPRTAIAQRKDGIVLMLVIDGRRAHSIGADLVDVTEILVNYGAYNAANLDGGSSTALIVNNEIRNVPVAGGPDGLRTIPNAFIVVK